MSRKSRLISDCEISLITLLFSTHRAMPLPKTASIAARATEVYSETWAVLLQKCWGIAPLKEDELGDIFQLLPYLRQLLTCCACAGLLEDAMISLVCGHCYCYQCQFRAPLLKIQCRQCRERRGLVIETQIRLLVNCYKRMCHILASELNQNPQILDGNGANPVNHVAVGGDEKDKENIGISSKGVGDSKTKSKTAASASFNPIAEILKEIEDGTKVSRAVLIVKPPMKYINARPMPTPKKDASLATKSAASATDKVEKEKEREGESDSPMETEAGASNTPSSSGGGADEKVKKKRGRKPKRQLIMPPVTEEDTEKTQQESSLKEKEQKGEKSQESGAPVTPVKSGKFVTVEDLARAKRAIDKVRPSQLEVSVKSLDSKLVRISGDTITVKEGVSTKGVEPFSGVKPGMLSYTRFVLDKDGNRNRIWDPLCPRIVVKRSRTSIDKMRNLQTRSVGAKLRSKERKRKTHTPPKQGESPSRKPSRQSSREFEVAFHLGVGGGGGMEREMEMGGEEMDHQRRLRELEQEHGLQLPDLDTDIDPDLELDASWLQELCEGLEEDFMVFAQPPIPGPPPPPPMPFPPPASSTPPHHGPPMFGGPPYSPQHHIPPPPHFSPHHPPPGFLLHPHHPPPPHHHHPPHPFLHPSARPPLPPPPPGHHPPHPPPPPPPPPRGPPPPTANRPPPIRIHRPTSPRGGQQVFSPHYPGSAKHPLPVIVGKIKVGKSAVYPPKPLLSPSQSASKAKKRRSPGYSESGWRCRCGTNNVMFPEKVCAKGKCPCYSKGIPCKNCLCRHCHNPFNNEEEEEEDLVEDDETTDQTDEPDQSEQSAEQVM